MTLRTRLIQARWSYDKWRQFRAKKAKFRKFISSNVNESERWVFFHVPKAAGTSIARALKLTQNSNHFAYVDYELLAPTRYLKHFTTFAFVREPISRFCSLYNYAKLDESHYHSARNPKAAIHGKHQDYDVLVNANINQCVELLANGKLKHYNGAGNFWLPQYHWLRDQNGGVRVTSIYSILAADSAVADLRNRYGIKIDDIPLLNKSADFSHKSNISSESLSILMNYYKDDYEHFGHLF